MVKMGIGVGVIGIFSEAIFFQDYWHPVLLFHFGTFGGIEDFFFGFAAGGIGVAIYDVVFHKSFRRKGNPHVWITPLLIVSEFLSIALFFHVLKLNSIYASTIGFIVPAVVIMIVRKDLIIETIYSAFLFGSLVIFLEVMVLICAPTYLKQYYVLYGKTPLIFGYGPLTEFIWSISFASVIGPFFDFKDGDVPVDITKGGYDGKTHKKKEQSPSKKSHE